MSVGIAQRFPSRLRHTCTYLQFIRCLTSACLWCSFLTNRSQHFPTNKCAYCHSEMTVEFFNISGPKMSLRKALTGTHYHRSKGIVSPPFSSANYYNGPQLDGVNGQPFTFSYRQLKGQPGEVARDTFDHT